MPGGEADHRVGKWCALDRVGGPPGRASIPFFFFFFFFFFFCSARDLFIDPHATDRIREMSGSEGNGRLMAPWRSPRGAGRLRPGTFELLQPSVVLVVLLIAVLAMIATPAIGARPSSVRMTEDTQRVDNAKAAGVVGGGGGGGGFGNRPGVSGRGGKKMEYNWMDDDEFVPEATGGPCEPCRVGSFYQPSFANCSICMTPGYCTNGTCPLCAAGTFQPDTGQLGCLNCTAGTYALDKVRRPVVPAVCL